MKKFFTLSLMVATALSVSAFEAKTKEPNFAEFQPAKSQVLKISEFKRLDRDAQIMKAPAAETEASPYNAFYKIHKGLYEAYGFGEQGFGYHTITPYVFVPFDGAYLKGVYGNKWTTYDGTDITSEVENNQLDLSGRIGYGYYLPTIWNDTASYYFGCDGIAAANGYGVYYPGYYAAADTLLVDLANYNLYGNTTLYSGYRNYVAYGSLEAKTSAGNKVTSDKLLVEYEVPAGQNLVIDHIEIPVIASYSADTTYASLWEDESQFLTATIKQKTDVEGEYKTYTATISKSDLDTIGRSIRMNIYFAEEIDGFESGVTPVLRNDFTLVIAGFAQSGIHMGIPMSYDESSYKSDAGYYTSEYYTHSYYEYIVDGESKGFYGNYYTEAIVNLVGSYYTLCEYSDYASDLYGEVPYGAKVYTDSETKQDYCVAVASVGRTDTTYYDFDIITPSAKEDLVITCDDPYFLDYQIDDTYFEMYKVYLIYFFTKPLPAGESERTLKGTISTDISSMNFTLRIMDANSTSLKTVAATPSTESVAYNLLGQRVNHTNAKGLYLINGKKVIK